MRKRTLLIINPISGTLPKEGLEQRVRERLEPAGFEIEVARTVRAGHGAELAANAAEQGYYAVIAAGGDGTVNEVAAALAGSGTILGILPFGSGNGLARHLYGSIDVDHALDVIALDSPSGCDYGTVNNEPFFCTFGLGFDAKVSSEFSHMQRRGLVSYVRSAMKEWLKYSPADYEITTGGKTTKIKAFLVAVCNASQYGNNAYIAPQASVHDGLLDIIVVTAGNPISQAFVGVELFTGQIDRNIRIQSFSVAEATIRHLPGPGHVDGEPRMMPQTVELKCRKGGIRIFTDPQKPPFKPFLTMMKSTRTDFRFLFKEYRRLLSAGLRKRLGKLFGKNSSD